MVCMHPVFGRGVYFLEILEEHITFTQLAIYF